MDRTKKRVLRNGLGIIGLFLLIGELLSLWSFLSSLHLESASVPFSLIFITFTANELFIPMTVLFSVAVIITLGLYYLFDTNAILGTTEMIFREAGAMFGLLPPTHISARAAVQHDSVRWIGDYEDDGRVIIKRQECPYCAIELETAHLPQIAARGERYEQHSDPLDGDLRLAGFQLTSVFRYPTESEDVIENLIEARACPQCSFAVPGSEVSAGGRQDVRNIIDSHINEMRTGDEEPFSQWRHRARERIGTTPSPGDLWDEYALESSRGEVQFVNVIDTPEATKRVEHNSYPALERLREDAEGMNRLIAGLREPLDVLVAKISRSSYIDNRRALLSERQDVRNRLLKRLTELEKQVGPQIDHALRLSNSRLLPEDPDDLKSSVVYARSELDPLHTELPDDFLTNGEQRRLSRLRSRLAETEDYFEVVLEYNEVHEALSTEIENFDEIYAPYEQQDRYMTTADQIYLQQKAATLHEDLQKCLQWQKPSELPQEAETWLLANRKRFHRLRETVQIYNQGNDERKGFIESQVQDHKDVFEHEHGELNPEQKAAVVRNDERNIVDASAGTGKTLTLTSRYEYLYRRGVSANDILVLTLTGPATSKLTDEISDTVAGIQDDEQLEVYNFHQFADGIVSRGIAEGLPKDWEAHEDKMREQYVQGFVNGSAEIRERYPATYEEFQTHVEEYCDVADVTEFPTDKLLKFLKEARNFDQSSSDIVTELTEARLEQYHFGQAAAAVLQAYRHRAEESDVPIDQLDRLDSATRIIKEYPEAFQDQYKHILVDEFQDVAEPSVRLIEALLAANDETRLFVVGDDWQSIYGFRGSNPSFFRDFQDRFDSVTKTTLKTNYRSPPAVVDASRDLIVDGTHNDKPVNAHSDSSELPQLYRIDGLYEPTMTQQVIKTVEEALERGRDPEDILILSRNLSSNPLIGNVLDRLRESGITVSTSSGTRGVTAQPIHSSKGKDEKCVILVHFTDEKKNGLPMEDRVDDLINPAKTSTVSSYLEEKRLAYVALTRTKQELHVYTKKGQESPFLDDIEDHFQSQTVSGPDNFSGMVTEATVVEGNRLKGELDCDDLRQTLSFVCLRWNLSDETFDNIVSTLETGTRCHIEQADDRTMDSFNDDIEITASTEVKQIPRSDTESDSASPSPDSSA